MRAVRLTVTAAATAAALTALPACTAKSDAKDGDAIRVTAADSTCKTSTKSVPAGQVTLKIENTGSRATEVEILFPDDRIVSEKENIGPGTKYTLTAEVKAGAYEIACRPGMKGHGVRQKLTVTGGGTSAERDPKLDKAVADYRQYVQDQADATLPLAETFVKAVKDATSTPPRRPTRPPVSAGSAPSRSPSPSVTSTPRSTSASPTWRPGRSGPAGTAWSRRCGRTRRWAPRRRPSPTGSSPT